MVLDSVRLKGIPPGRPPFWILPGGWMPFKRELARIMASAFWWRITVTPKSLENHRKNKEVGLLCSLFCDAGLRNECFSKEINFMLTTKQIILIRSKHTISEFIQFTSKLELLNNIILQMCTICGMCILITLYKDQNYRNSRQGMRQTYRIVCLVPSQFIRGGGSLS